ncbi:MAG: hypothetical protein WCT25_04510 [Candidatus Paceibacterota bacterium]|jgi:hypothetical protein
MIFARVSKKGGVANEWGISLVEILIYVAVMTMFLILIVNAVQSFSKSYRSMHSAQNVELSAETALERLTREIRGATSVDTAQSTLGSSPGILFLNTTDDAGTALTVKFFLSGQVLHVSENGVDQGPLTSSAVRVTNLVFRSITATKSKAVKIELATESGSGSDYRSKSFYSTVVMRGSYPLQ